MLDPQIRQCLTIAPGPNTEALFLTAPVRWIEAGEDGEMTALGVGSLDGKQRKEPVATLHSLATRVATHSSGLQRQRTQDSLPNSGPTTAQSQPVSQKQPAIASQPLSQDTSIISHLPPSLQPASNIDSTEASDHGQPSLADKPFQHPLASGGPPERISIPPPPVQIERTKTEFVTPPTDPSEIKTLA